MTKEYNSTGKWILAGEHSVLRGSRALVFPLPSMQMNLVYEESDRDLVAHFHGSTGENYQILFYGLVDRALEILGRPRKDLKGSIKLDSNLPLGNGLGASAALCVAVGRWLTELGWVDSVKLESFCRELENLFHGESSGVDVAVVLSGQPLCFSRFAPSEKIAIRWKPHFYLSSSGQKGLTHSCVQKVKDFIQVNPVIGQQLDEQMANAVELMRNLLISEGTDSEVSTLEMVQAINQARQCFEAWGLTEGAVEREMRMLQEAGALAVKPTGSGAGGYVLSLWSSEPPMALRHRLISCG
jgi:mevalonate kinase